MLKADVAPRPHIDVLLIKFSVVAGALQAAPHCPPICFFRAQSPGSAIATKLAMHAQFPARVQKRTTCEEGAPTVHSARSYTAGAGAKTSFEKTSRNGGVISLCSVGGGWGIDTERGYREQMGG